MQKDNPQEGNSRGIKLDNTNIKELEFPETANISNLKREVLITKLLFHK